MAQVMTTALLNVLANAANITHISLHSGNPGTTGANEISGNGYARQPVALPAAAGGIRSASGSPLLTFEGPANADVKWIGFCSAATGGWLGAFELPGPEDTKFNSLGLYGVRSISFTAEPKPL